MKTHYNYHLGYLLEMVANLDDSWTAVIYTVTWEWAIDIIKPTYAAAYSAARRWMEKNQ